MRGSGFADRGALAGCGAISGAFACTRPAVSRSYVRLSRVARSLVAARVSRAAVSDPRIAVAPAPSASSGRRRPSSRAGRTVGSPPARPSACPPGGQRGVGGWERRVGAGGGLAVRDRAVCGGDASGPGRAALAERRPQRRQRRRAGAQRASAGRALSSGPRVAPSPARPAGPAFPDRLPRAALCRRHAPPGRAALPHAFGGKTTRYPTVFQSACP